MTDTIIISQFVPICADTTYRFTAFTREPYPANLCTAIFTIGSYPLGFTNHPEPNTDWQELSGVFGPVTSAGETLAIQVTCVGAPNIDGVYNIYIDDVVLAALV